MSLCIRLCNHTYIWHGMKYILHAPGKHPGEVTTKERKGEAMAWMNESAHTQKRPCDQHAIITISSILSL